jgi:hypothetical protein
MKLEYADLREGLKNIQIPNFVTHPSSRPGIRGTQVKSSVQMKKTQESSK